MSQEKKENIMTKFVDILAKLFKSVKVILDKSKVYDRVEAHLVGRMEDKLSRYRISQDRALLHDLVEDANLIRNTGINGRTTDLVKEIMDEHELQLQLKPSSSIKK